MPAFRHFSLSPGIAYAVSATTGTAPAAPLDGDFAAASFFSSSIFRIRRVASYPSSTGMLQSIRMRSYGSERAWAAT